MTGRIVFAASMPGRWAAPPAPAMITRMPRPGADLGVAVQVVRAAVGGDDPQLAGHARAARGRSTAFSRIGKSERLPPTTPTSGSVIGSPARSASLGLGAQPMWPAASRARASASSGVAPSAVTWPIFRRSNTVALVVQVEVRVGHLERLVDAGRVRRSRRALAEQVDHRRRGGAHARPSRAAARRSPAGAARTGS